MTDANNAPWPFCDACQSWHHPDNPSCRANVRSVHYDGYIACAMPVDPAERAKLQQLVPDAPLPAIVPESINQPCSQCGLMLSVGPRLQAKMRDDPRVILRCMHCLPANTTFDAQHLGNPNSKPESVWD